MLTSNATNTTSHLHLLGYDMAAWRTKTSDIEARWGCELHPLDRWPQLLQNLCEKYEPAAPPDTRR